MNKLKITGKELRAIGYPESPAISIAMDVIQKHYKYSAKNEAIALLKQILGAPKEYLNDKVLSTIAERLIPKERTENPEIPLNSIGVPVSIFGREYIEEGALHQIYQAAKLPISIAAALLPDAHSGYGLPIGGVLATNNAVIPYGVGVDIGCRMCLSIFDIAPRDLKNKEAFFSRVLDKSTLFGSGAHFNEAYEHEVMEKELFYQIPLLRTLHGKARKQLGSSGSGNHFAEFGIIEITEKDAALSIDAGSYIGFMTHSGSRGLGANIANYYTRIALTKRHLPQEAKNLAWLSLDEEAGMEYWLAMNLAGNYASACHQVIHQKIANQLGRLPIKVVENHHNFAWKEMFAGKEVIVHRKGATPAGKNVLGIIPGSMTADGYIVKGKGIESSLYSASHGAGRKMSRTRAKESVTDKQFKDELQKFGVLLLGGGPDESPFAYKDINTVMKSQKTLVDTIGSFTPKIVKMDGAKHKR